MSAANANLNVEVSLFELPPHPESIAQDKARATAFLTRLIIFLL
jgi:hypothetical protein